MTKRGKEIENAVRVLERLIDAVPEPQTEADLQMFVKILDCLCDMQGGSFSPFINRC